MGSFSNHWEDEVLDHLFGKGAYNPPTVHVALSTCDPGDDGAGLSEPAGNGYARVQTTPTDWTAADGGLIENATAITFGPATGNWGTVTHFALFDAPSGGHLLAHGVLTQARAIAAGQSPEIAPGELDVRLS